MSFKMKIAAFLLSVLLIFSLTACAGEEASTTASEDVTSSADRPIGDPTMFDEQDKKTEIDEKTATKVALDGKSLTIGRAGEYLITKSITDGQLVIDTDKNSVVHLVLKGVSITSSGSPAIYVKKAKKVIITLAEDSENYLRLKGGNAESQEDSLGGALYSKCDLALNGKGKLVVTSDYGKGIVSTDNLVITDGTIKVEAEGHAFDGNDSIRIADGSLAARSFAGDGFHVENVEDTTKGNFYSMGGSFDLTSYGDGIAASGYLKLEGGSYKIVAGDRASNNSADRNKDHSSEDDILSRKGMKAGGDLFVTGGKLSISSEDDGIHSNGNVTLSGGDGVIATGDDGIHADKTLTISGGKYDITESYEGLEGISIAISGGETLVASLDDGLNAAGGNDPSGFGGALPPEGFDNSESSIKISGGLLYVNSSGDGIDSNGDLIVSGGETYISGPTDFGNSALDFGGTATVSGGIFMAAGPAGMAQNFNTSSTQGAMLVNLRCSDPLKEVTVTDSSGKVLAAHAFEKAFDTVLISAPDIKAGETYTVSADGKTETVKMTSVIYGATDHRGGMKPKKRW